MLGFSERRHREERSTGVEASTKARGGECPGQLPCNIPLMRRTV